MAIVPNTLASGATVVASELNQNFSALETAITGNLTEASLSASTAIPNSKLDNASFVFTVPLLFRGGTLDAATASWVATNDYVDTTAELPYDSSEGVATYTVLGIDITYRCTYGGSSPNFSVEWGHVSAGAWTTAAGAGGTGVVLVSPYSLAGATAVLTGPVSMTLANNSISTNASQPRCLAIVHDGTDAGFSGAGDFLSVTVKLKRELRS